MLHAPTPRTVASRCSPIGRDDVRGAGYRTDLDHDLLLVSLTGLKGFYENVPRDRRQGVALGSQTGFGASIVATAKNFRSVGL